MSDSLFVDKKAEIHTGQEAEEALKKITDQPYLTSSQGVVRVSRRRWQEAQEYELTTWMDKGAHATEDRNRDHFQHFDGYDFLKGKTFRHAVELGCGPFTNLRHIMPVCKIDQCSLLDPLAKHYLQHRNCTYTGNFLRGNPKPLFTSLENNRLKRAVRRGIRAMSPRSLFEGIPVRRLYALPIEEMPEQTQYDLAVMINVIEHCYDIETIWKKILNILKPGGVFVFHDKYYYHSQVADRIHKQYDAGHPLKTDRAVIDQFLENHFQPLFRKIAHKESLLDGIDLGYDAVYFIGSCDGPSPGHSS